MTLIVTDKLSLVAIHWSKDKGTMRNDMYARAP